MRILGNNLIPADICIVNRLSSNFFGQFNASH